MILYDLDMAFTAPTVHSHQRKSDTINLSPPVKLNISFYFQKVKDRGQLFETSSSVSRMSHYIAMLIVVVLWIRTKVFSVLAVLLTKACLRTLNAISLILHLFLSSVPSPQFLVRGLGGG